MEFITEFTKAQIAVLVLGYLKSEKCYKAFDEFLEESPFFQKNRQNIKLGKYFVTRVAGMCLVDFLEEYAAIYAIVQGRLEASNYFNEVHSKTSLVEQILYLLDSEGATIVNSTPFSARNEVDTTPIHTLPGHDSDESESSTSKTPKRKTSRSKSTSNKNSEKDDMFDVSEVLTQTLLENHELHEKIAETINIVRNTPEASKTVLDEHIRAGASKELDAIIKTVVQRTEEDPIYNRLIDDLIGTAPFDNPPIKKPCNASPPSPPCSDHPEDLSKPKPTENQNSISARIEDHNNDAVRSIIEASQNPEVPPPPTTLPQNSEANKNENGEVYVFDGTLDTYLKSSGGANPIAPNPVYINTGGLIVMPPVTTSKQFYIVNNQPLINMNVSAVKGVISDNDIMAMPTIIVNDETQPTFPNQSFSVTTTTNKNLPNKRNKTPKIAPKIPPKNDAGVLSEFLTLNTTQPEKKKNNTTKDNLVNSIPTMTSEPSTVVVTASQTTPSVITTPTTKAPTAVRNLDFSSPAEGAEEKKQNDVRTWDAELRKLAKNCVARSPTPKRKRPTTSRPKKKAKAKKEEAKKEDEEVKIEAKKEEIEGSPISATPINEVPKTPGVEVSTTNNFHCTPFNDVLEEQLRGVDLISLPTPKIPITPGFALNLTPADIPPYNNRSTDYSTSSSYYQPSDNEQNKSIDQLIEECKRLENTSPPPPVKILSDVVIEQAKTPRTVEKKKNCEDHLKKFNHNVIGKKNLSLLKRATSSSSSSDSSDTESEKSGDHSNKTVICKDNEESKITDAVSISNIISTVEVKDTLDEETKRKNLLSHLEEVRKRTIHKIKNPPELVKKPRANKKPAKTPKTEPKKKKNAKKKESVDESNTDEEAQKLVTGLAQRGIHLIHKKTPKKKNSKMEETTKIEEKKNSKVEAPKFEEKKSKAEAPKIEEKQSKAEAPKIEEKKNSEMEAEVTLDDDSCVVFDKKCYEDFEIVVHKDKDSKGKNLKNYDMEVLKKGFEARVYAEHLKEEVTRTMRLTCFETLAELPIKINILTPRKAKRIDEEIDNDLMDYVIAGSVREESPDTKQASKGGKKRKSRLSEDDNKQIEKKSKTFEHNIKLLKKIDVEDFLDKVHGE